MKSSIKGRYVAEGAGGSWMVEGRVRLEGAAESWVEQEANDVEQEVQCHETRCSDRS